MTEKKMYDDVELLWPTCSLHGRMKLIAGDNRRVLWECQTCDSGNELAQLPVGPAAPQTPLEQFVDTTFPPFGVLRIPESERREPTPADFADPRFDVVWELVKRLDVDFGNGLRSGATGNDVCAILDRLSRASSPSPSTALRELVEEWRETMRIERQAAKEEDEREADLLNHSADTFEICADAVAALLGSTESP